MQRRFLTSLWVAALMLAVVPVWAGQGIEAATDRTTYNIGSEVHLKIAFPPGADVLPASSFVASVRYGGESKPLVDQAPLVPSGGPSSASSALDSGSDRSTGYHLIWRIRFANPPAAPGNAHTDSQGKLARRRFAPS